MSAEKQIIISRYDEIPKVSHEFLFIKLENCVEGEYGKNIVKIIKREFYKKKGLDNSPGLLISPSLGDYDIEISLPIQIEQYKLLKDVNTGVSNINLNIDELIEQGRKYTDIHIVRFNQLQSEHDRLKTDYNQLKTDHDHLEAEYNQLKTDHDHLKTNYDMLRTIHDSSVCISYDEIKRHFLIPIMVLTALVIGAVFFLPVNDILFKMLSVGGTIIFLEAIYLYRQLDKPKDL